MLKQVSFLGNRYGFFDCPKSWRTRSIRSAASDRSRIVNDGLRPIWGRVLPQQTSANGMEGAGPRQIDLLTAEGRRGDPLHSPDHLLGGSAGKRQKQDAVRINPVDDQMCNP